MTDDLPRGLGAIPSPPDPRDWPVDLAYATLGVDRPASLPSAYTVPDPQAPTMSQVGGTCVPNGTGWLKVYQDLRDTGLFVPDIDDFLKSIGGDPVAGAVPRYALQQLLDFGYPERGNVNAAKHRIAAYYRVPVTVADIKAALVAFGPIGLGLSWQNSWWTTTSAGVLRAPTTFAGGHWLVIVGWDDSRGLLLQNSWGADWGVQGGRCYLPYAYLLSNWPTEAWKAVDVIDPKPTGTYRVQIAAGARVRVATVTPSGLIAGWTDVTWGATASSAPCRAPVVKRGTHSGQATVAYVTKGSFAGRWVRVGDGVAVTRS